jgi:hypothetical protein
MGMILLPLGALVIGLYLWAVVKGVRWAYRKFKIQGAIAAVAFFALLPTWDTITNQYYYRQVLCKRPEAGLHIFKNIVLPTEMYDDKGNPKLPDSMNDPQHPFLGKYVFDIRYQDEGSYPVTAYRRLLHGTYDVSTNQFLSKFEDYQPRGGWLWTNALRLVLTRADYDWIMSRGQTQSCFERTQFWKMVSDAKAKPFTGN